MVVREILQRVQLFLKPFISERPTRKAVSMAVPAGNELVSSEVFEFVGFVVSSYYSIQHLGHTSPASDSSSLHTAACFARGTYFNFSQRTQGSELPLFQNK